MNSVVPLLHFGKLPSRGDFVRSSGHADVVLSIDQWLSHMLEQLSATPNWKDVYDKAPVLNFACLGVQDNRAVAGHMMASSDASGRRFPFVVAGAIEVEQPLAFVGCAPLALARLWVQSEQWARKAASADDPDTVLQALGQATLEVATTASAYQATSHDFEQLLSVGDLQALLQLSHPQANLKRIVLGLGLVLRPVPASGISELERGLRLPVPADRLQCFNVAAWWLSLVVGFVARADFQLLLLMPQARETGQGPWLYVGFAGRSAEGLGALLDPDASEQSYVSLLAPEWADQPDQEWDYGLKKLAECLDDPGAPLAQLSTTFREVFLGA